MLPSLPSQPPPTSCTGHRPPTSTLSSPGRLFLPSQGWPPFKSRGLCTSPPTGPTGRQHLPLSSTRGGRIFLPPPWRSSMFELHSPRRCATGSAGLLLPWRARDSSGPRSHARLLMALCGRPLPSSPRRCSATPAALAPRHDHVAHQYSPTPLVTNRGPLLSSVPPPLHYSPPAWSWTKSTAATPPSATGHPIRRRRASQHRWSPNTPSSCLPTSSTAVVLHTLPTGEKAAPFLSTDDVVARTSAAPPFDLCL